ncbi:MAG: protein kinase [Bacteroidia bacterium]
MHTRWTEIQDWFERLMDADPEAQKAALGKLAEDKPILAAEVADLLALDENPHTLMREGLQIKPEAESRIGDRFGVYEVKEHLASGGMGAVYLATRVGGDFDREVALKVVQGGFLTERLIPQFQEERQILAQLQHPNIARLYDGGISEGGEPYFTMELVNGRSLTHYVKEEKLDQRSRLKLFLQVCNAMQYAHRQLIVHLDLKPGNMLVTEEEQIKLLDFGVSRLVKQQDTESKSGPSSAMTKAYASPEQLAGGHISTQSDVYSLGVVMYELLFEERPDRSVPRRENKSELDLIIEKAMAESLDQRYESVEALKEDIEAFLAQRPISLKSDWGYRTALYLKRNLFAASLVGLAAILLIGTVSFYTGRLANERNLAQSEAQKSRQVLEMMKTVFLEVDPEAAPGEKLSAEAFLGRALPKVNEYLEDEPEAKAELLSFWGYLYRNQAQYERSDSLFAASAELYDQMLDPPLMYQAVNFQEWSNTKFYNNELAAVDSLLTMAIGLIRQSGNWNDSIAASINRSFADVAYEIEDYPRADSLYQTVYDWTVANSTDSFALSEAIHYMGMTARKRSEFEAADSLFREALAIKRAVLKAPHSEIAFTLNYLCSTAIERGLYEEAKAYAAASLKQRQAIFVPHHPEISASMSNYARCLIKLGQFDSAEVMYRFLSESIEKSFGTQEHPSYVATQQSLVGAIMYQKKYDEAEAVLIGLKPLFDKVYGLDSYAHSFYYSRLGEIKFYREAFREAVKPFKKSLELRKTFQGTENRNYAQAAFFLGKTYYKLNQMEKARPYLEQALAVFKDFPVRYEANLQNINHMLNGKE